MNSLTLYPAIDLRDGKCVRLLQGDYAQETVYSEAPLDMAAAFVEEGAQWLHMVDLDGAKEGKRRNHSLVTQAATTLDVSIQVGGGIRTERDVYEYLSHGVKRVILGSAAIAQPSFVSQMLRQYKEAIAIGIDARDGYVATHGWLQTSSIKATELAKALVEEGAETFIFTDIASDGMLSGPNQARIAELREATQKQVIASGGISSLNDLQALQEDEAGIAGAIIGKALYTGQFTLREALKKVTIC
ncbi:1-(5-phosphoribosyl)-5-[(5-phosphoribosylamino)methylideneamino] imidazole-4-carboxamide isomerase [Fictibacillus macauensis ZFHKF-1]|uniref:1-(5-phosphoribosyl)-5-[(5-phosphoribosylamino)methylideneamino] imidazole-4-carboxamide isomerase n=1 Tax=Fictibacillus macauensis ZFHKF-1 TaxID=1196324 RepID=I8J5F2_9BACL|nr:1-(5-phosphoribosyl)-5-[(5-phosphoribosylamino)methylideneamino]imidazole-4-carboxamide isomerase [Fictibacillus macauensis]EIT87016.1 1-(5-phosphoribosyl)-5-[(5-phosphoribosylamino)methylideneamino] imidazole-4-carboxamide isomerase [Fictibacillus macauensis ZFHKF-1]